MQWEVGVCFRNCRQERDVQMQENVTEFLVKQETSFSTCNLLVVKSPDYSWRSELYWQSIEDFLAFFNDYCLSEAKDIWRTSLQHDRSYTGG
jgi:predicted PilT family ATPase